MITTLEQCKKIQTRRKKAKKSGYSKAVRNFLFKHCNGDVVKYLILKESLPVYWATKEKKEPENPKQFISLNCPSLIKP